MKILVTGATGFIGSHFLELSGHTSHEVYALKSPASKGPRITLSHNPIWIKKSIDELGITDLEGIEVIVHFASVGVSPVKSTWRELMYWNVDCLIRLLELAKQSDVRRVVVAGSSVEYGLSADHYEFIPTSANLLPLSDYAASKAAGYHAIASFANNCDLELYYLRVFTAYGSGQNELNFWPSLRSAALAGDDFPMTSGEQVRDFIPVEEVASAFLAAMEDSELATSCNPFVVNIGSGTGLSLREFAESQWRAWGAKGELLFGEIAHRSDESLRSVPQLNWKWNE